MQPPTVLFLFAIFALPAFGLAVGIAAATIAGKIRGTKKGTRTTTGVGYSQLQIDLPRAMAEMVAAKVASGEFASADEVMLEGLRLLMSRDSRTWE